MCHARSTNMTRCTGTTESNNALQALYEQGTGALCIEMPSRAASTSLTLSSCSRQQIKVKI